MMHGPLTTCSVCDREFGERPNDLCENAVHWHAYVTDVLEPDNRRLTESVASWKDAWFDQRRIIGRLWWHHPQLVTNAQVIGSTSTAAKREYKYFARGRDFARIDAGGELPQDEESSWAERLDILWRCMTKEDQEAIEAELRASTSSARQITSE